VDLSRVLLRLPKRKNAADGTGDHFVDSTSIIDGVGTRQHELDRGTFYLGH
jgi:hypothetical protein